MSINLSTPLSLYSIPVVWFTAFYPGTLKFLLITKTTGYNNVQPRANTGKLKQTKGIPADIASRAERMEGAHLNGFECLPLWAAAVLAGNFVGLEHKTLNVISIAYIATRLLFNHIYINQTTVAMSNLRTATFFAGLSMPLYLLVKSANIAATR